MKMISPETMKNIVDLTESVPEMYRIKCFELLLNHALIQLDSNPEIFQQGGAVHPVISQRKPDASVTAPLTPNMVIKGESKGLPKTQKLNEPLKPEKSSKSEELATGTDQKKKTKPFVMPPEIKNFLANFGIQESTIWKIFKTGNEGIEYIYELNTTRNTRAQIQHALLMALESALETGKFQLDIEALQERCQKEGVYEAASFRLTLESNADFFRVNADEKTLSLSNKGLSELVIILEQFEDDE